jgi:hypothetical protein
VAGMSEIQIAEDFLASAEYQAAHRNNTSFVDGLYRDVLGRTESSSEQAGWLQFLQTGGTRAQAEQLFLTSLEKYIEVVNRYYANLLQRMPDTGGQLAWVNSLLQGQETLEAVAEAFLASDEFFAKVLSGIL